MYEQVITPEKAYEILKTLKIELVDFRKSSIAGYSQVDLPDGGKLNHHPRRGYWLSCHKEGL